MRQAVALAAFIVLLEGVCLGGELTPSIKLGPLPRDQEKSGEARKVSLPEVQQDAYEFVREGRHTLEVDPRVIGGQPAPVGAYPWQVSIGLSNVPTSVGHFCGGSVVAPNWVVTAAHCVDGTTQPNTIQVRYGTNFLSEGGKLALVAQIIVHDSWKRAAFDYDVALLRITEPINAPAISLVMPAEAAELVPIGVIATVSGWGLTKIGSSISDVLQQVGVQVTSNETCSSSDRLPGEDYPKDALRGLCDRWQGLVPRR